jgi:hypothetical protein
MTTESLEIKKTEDIGPQIKMQLDQMVDQLNNMPIGMSLVWLWVWDLIRDKYKNYEFIDEMSDYVVTPGTTLDIIWEKLWANPPSDFTLEYGAEQVDEAILDWMIDNEFLSAVDEDGWLDEEGDTDVVDE